MLVVPCARRPVAGRADAGLRHRRPAALEGDAAGRPPGPAPATARAAWRCWPLARMSNRLRAASRSSAGTPMAHRAAKWPEGARRWPHAWPSATSRPDIRPGQTAPGPQPYDGVLLSNGVLAAPPKPTTCASTCARVYRGGLQQPSAPGRTGPSAVDGRAGVDADPSMSRSRVDDCNWRAAPALPRALPSSSRSAWTRFTRDAGRLPGERADRPSAVDDRRFRELTVYANSARATLHQRGVIYSGSDDDGAEPARCHGCAPIWPPAPNWPATVTPPGRLLPTLALHGIDDPVAFVKEMEPLPRHRHRGRAAERLAQAWPPAMPVTNYPVGCGLCQRRSTRCWTGAGGGARPDGAALEQRCHALPSTESAPGLAASWRATSPPRWKWCRCAPAVAAGVSAAGRHPPAPGIRPRRSVTTRLPGAEDRDQARNDDQRPDDLAQISLQGRLPNR